MESIEKLGGIACLRALKVRSRICGMSERIEINPRVCGGQPVIKGTRIPVAVILEQLAGNESWDSLLVGYPELTRDDIHAALEYARRSILHTEITSLDAA
jgi:uncharacterized protein (DUF433 family)